MFDLRDVVTYLAQRVGLLHGRVWFGAGNAVNATLTFNACSPLGQMFAVTRRSHY